MRTCRPITKERVARHPGRTVTWSRNEQRCSYIGAHALLGPGRLGRALAIAATLLATASVTVVAQSQDARTIEAYVRLLGSTNPRVVDSASFRLATMRAAALPALMAALRSNSAPVRARAAKTLGRMGAGAASSARQLGALLRDPRAGVRFEAANALWNLGPAARAAIPEMAAAIGDTLRGEDLVLAQVLDDFGSAAAPAIPGLIRVLEREDDWEKQSAAQTLGMIGRGAVAAEDALLAATGDADEETRATAALALGRVSDGDVRVVRRLISLLNDFAPAVREAAMRGVGSLGRPGAPAAKALGRLTHASDRDTRQKALEALKAIGPSAKSALPELIGALEDTAWLIRQPALHAIDSIGPDAKIAAPAVARLVTARMVGDDARRALLRIGPVGDSILLSQVRSGEADPDVVRAYHSMGVNAIPQLIVALREGDAPARLTAARALEAIRDSTGRALSALRSRLGDRDDRVRAAVVDAVISTGPASLDMLLSVMRSGDERVRSSAAEALGRLNRPEARVKHALHPLLTDERASVRISAAVALARLGESSRQVLGPLAEAIESERPEVRQFAALASRDIAIKKHEARDVEALSLLRAIRSRIRSSDDADVRKNEGEIGRVIDYLERIFWENKLQQARVWADHHKGIVVFVVVELALLVVALIVYLVRPLWLLQLNEALQPVADLKLPEWAFGVTLSLRYALILGFFHHRPRVLDAWVAKYSEDVRAEFGRKATVRERAIHVTLPVSIDGEVVPSPGVRDFRRLFGRKRALVLIRGEGGAGKTSLACQLAWAALSDDPEQRLFRDHPALPVLVEHDFRSGNTSELPLDAVARGQLSAALGRDQPLSLTLFQVLLRRKRVLVILDHLSEMGDDTRSAVRFDSPDFSTNALIVTSRLPEELHGVPRQEIAPLRIQGDRLSTFMEAYLSRRGKRELFDDTEYFEYCRRLSEMVGQSDATPLLAKLYAEQIIALKERALGARLPESIPDLMLSYLNEINRGATSTDPQDREVHRIARIIAWRCVSPSFRPRTASRVTVSGDLAEIGASEQVLLYLEAKLRLIQTVGPAREEFRFSLDPVAEYLAALHVVELFGDNESEWRFVLSRIEGVQGSPESIKGFIHALRNSVVAKGGLNGTPRWVSDELAKLAGLEPEALERAKLKQRIRRLTYSLSLPHTEDRITAANSLAKLGEDAAEAVPALRAASESAEQELREAAVAALHAITGE